MTEQSKSCTNRRRVVAVIPARNEERTVGAVVHSVLSASYSERYDLTVLVVNDGSGDRTECEARSAGATIVRTTDVQGLGAAFRVGVQAALNCEADTFLTLDADGQYRAEDGARLLELVDLGCDLAIGDRLCVRPGWMRPSRYLANRAFSHLIGTLLNRSIVDTQSGLRVFNRRVAENCLPRQNFTYTQEQYVRAVRLGYGVKSAPIQFEPRTTGQSRLVRSTVRYAAQAVPGTARALYEPLALGSVVPAT